MHGAVAAAMAGAPPGGWYKVHGTICQPAFWCSLPCGECSKLRFEIYHADDAGMTKPVGHLARVFPGCLKALATDADNYTIEYPVDATPMQKAALASTTVLLDFIMFGARGDRRGAWGGMPRVCGAPERGVRHPCVSCARGAWGAAGLPPSERTPPSSRGCPPRALPRRGQRQQAGRRRRLPRQPAERRALRGATPDGLVWFGLSWLPPPGA